MIVIYFCKALLFMEKYTWHPDPIMLIGDHRSNIKENYPFLN